MNLKRNDGIITLIFFALATTVCVTSQSIITTSLTNIMSEFSISSTMVQWTYSAYLLVLGVMVPPIAYITHKFKMRTILLSSLLSFILGSAVSFFSTNIWLLVIGRILQAVGSGVLLPTIQILIFEVLSEDRWPLAMGILGFAIGIAPCLAPTIGGVITDLFGWHANFEMLAAVSFIIWILAFILARYESESKAHPLDVSSLLLAVISCVGIIFGFSNISEFGSDLIYVILPIITGIASLAVFVRRQKTVKSPLIKLDVLKNKYFVAGNVITALLYFIICGVNVILPLFIQGVAHHSATVSGLVILPGTLIMIVCNFIGPVLAKKIGPRIVLVSASIFTLLGLVGMMFYDINTSINFYIITQIFRCIGTGLGAVTALNWALTVVSYDVEDATAINNTLRQIAGAIGSAAMVVVFTVFAGGAITHNGICKLICYNLSCNGRDYDNMSYNINFLCKIRG